MTEKPLIDEFLAEKRIAVVGVSRDPGDFSRRLFRDLRKFGYEALPVRPDAAEIDGVACVGRLQDLDPAPKAALLLTRPEVTDRVVMDCREAGVGLVWMYRAAGQGAVSREAVDYCDAHGIRVIAGYCPYMFLRQAGWIHKLHGWLIRLVSGRPR